MLGAPSFFFFFFNDTATTEIYTLSLHDALPIFLASSRGSCRTVRQADQWLCPVRSEEHTSELQSPCNLVCRLLLEKKKKNRAHLDITIILLITSISLLYYCPILWLCSCHSDCLF